MAVTTINLSNILKTDEAMYAKFADKYIAMTFKLPTTFNILNINGCDYADIHQITDDNVIIANTEDSNKPIYNWDYFNGYNLRNPNPYGNLFWTMPTSGVSAHITRFTHSAVDYVSLFGRVNANGTLVPNLGIGQEVSIAIDPLALTTVVFEDLKIEAQPYARSTNLPCYTVVNYYAGTGVLSISL